MCFSAFTINYGKRIRPCGSDGFLGLLLSLALMESTAVVSTSRQACVQSSFYCSITAMNKLGEDRVDGDQQYTGRQLCDLCQEHMC